MRHYPYPDKYTRSGPCQEKDAATTAKGARTGSGKIRMSKSLSVSAEINLLGKTVDEAMSVLDKYLDDAYLAHLPSVRIVHGRDGRVKKRVTEPPAQGEICEILPPG